MPRLTLHLVPIPELSGPRMGYFTLVDQHDVRYFDDFVEWAEIEHPKELEKMISELMYMAEKGYRQSYFEMEEGSPDDAVIAMHALPKQKLRLYCLQFGRNILILGDGGHKRTRTYQEDKVLFTIVKELQDVSHQISDRIRTGQIQFDDIKNRLIGNLTFTVETEP